MNPILTVLYDVTRSTVIQSIPLIGKTTNVQREKSARLQVENIRSREIITDVLNIIKYSFAQHIAKVPTFV